MQPNPSTSWVHSLLHTLPPISLPPSPPLTSSPPLGSHSPVWSQLRCAPISSYAVQTVLVLRVCVHVCVSVCAKWFQLTASACSNYSHAPFECPRGLGEITTNASLCFVHLFAEVTLLWGHSHNVAIHFLVLFIYWKIYQTVIDYMHYINNNMNIRMS